MNILKKLVLGSLNIDRNYQVERFVAPGETMAAKAYHSFCGGKGFNQAVALARAGTNVHFAGVVGADGDMLLRELTESGVDTTRIRRSQNPNGHAVIQVDEHGQNCIIIVAGSNGEVSMKDIDGWLQSLSPGDLVLMQNEISHVDYALQAARKKDLFVAFNPSPMQQDLGWDLTCVNLLLINEIEGAAITGTSHPKAILETLKVRYPQMQVVLTLGHQGACHMDQTGMVTACGILDIPVVDTTAAGDTFSGYFLSAITDGRTSKEALELGTVASALAVSKKGASASIPGREQVEKLLQNAILTPFQLC